MINEEDIQDLKQLVDYLKEQQVAEFELERGDLKVRLKFTQPAPATAIPLSQVIASGPGIMPAPAVAAVPPAAAPAAPAAPAPDANLHVIKSPIVGTFYGSPSPGSSAFVSPGDRVEKGQVVCIVEAMKLMNEIEADASGEIVKCLVVDGQPVEFGQPLFTVKVA